jgi:hypothetical protein
MLPKNNINQHTQNDKYPLARTSHLNINVAHQLYKKTSTSSFHKQDLHIREVHYVHVHRKRVIMNHVLTLIACIKTCMDPFTLSPTVEHKFTIHKDQALLSKCTESQSDNHFNNPNPEHLTINAPTILQAQVPSLKKKLPNPEIPP